MTTRLENKRKGIILKLSAIYSADPTWVVWDLLEGFDEETIEENLREWLLAHGCHLVGKTFVVVDEDSYRRGLYQAQEAREHYIKVMQFEADLDQLNQDLADKGLIS